MTKVNFRESNENHEKHGFYFTDDELFALVSFCDSILNGNSWSDLSDFDKKICADILSLCPDFVVDKESLKLRWRRLNYDS